MSAVRVSTEQLRNGVVAHIKEQRLEMVKRLLDAPSISLEIQFPTTDVRKMTAEQFDVFAKKFAAKFDGTADIIFRSWQTDVQVRVREIEGELSSIGHEDFSWRTKQRHMKTLITDFNTELDRRCEALATSLHEPAQAAYDSAYRAALRLVGAEPPRTRARLTATCTVATPIPPVGMRTVTIVPRSVQRTSGTGVDVRTLPRLRP